MMSQVKRYSLVAMVGIALSTGIASAQGTGDPGAPGATTSEDTSVSRVKEAYLKGDWPSELVFRSTVWPEGMIEIIFPIGINLSKDREFKQVSIAPDVWYGVMQDLSVGITHSTGICIGGEENGCVKVYNDIALEALYRFLRGEFDMSAHAGIPVSSFDPFMLGIELGVKGRLVLADGKLGILFDPSFRIGFTERDAGNKEFINIPVQLAFQATPQLAVGLGTSFGGPLSGFGDNFTGSLEVFGLYNINKMADVFLQFAFVNLYGKNPEGVGAADARAIVIGANLHL